MSDAVRQARRRRQLRRQLMVALYNSRFGEEERTLPALGQLAAQIGVEESELTSIWNDLHREKVISTYGVSVITGAGSFRSPSGTCLTWKGLEQVEAVAIEESSYGADCRRFLETLFELADGQLGRFVSKYNCGQQAGTARSSVSAIVRHLSRLGLVTEPNASDCISLTVDGVLAVNRGELPRGGNSAVDQSVTNNLQNSQVGTIAVQHGQNQGQLSSVGHVSLGSEDLLAQFMSQLAAAGATEDDLHLAGQQVELLRAEAGRASPREGVIAGCLSSLRAVAEGVASGVLVSILNQYCGFQAS